MSSNFDRAGAFAGEPVFYGSVPGPGPADLRREPLPLLKRTPPRLARLLQVLSALACFVIPCVLFVGVLAALSLGVQLRAAVEAGAGVVVLLLGVLAHGAWRASRGPVWHILLFVTSLLGWIAAVVLGSQSYASIAPYYNMINMATYIEVNTFDVSGALLQDAGRILFTPETYVDRSKAIAFKDTDLYCAAPVITPHTGPGDDRYQGLSYDFWVVGMNCCDNAGANFTCGEVSNSNAYAGLRLMDAAQQGYYRMAVQQAEAAYGIKAEHPLFFTWMQDPWAYLVAPWDEMCHRLLVQSVTFCTAQLFLVSLAWFAVAANAKVDD